jgi:hypothetical protein
MEHKLKGTGKITQKSRIDWNIKKIIIAFIPLVLIILLISYFFLASASYENSVKSLNSQDNSPHTQLLVLWYPPTLFPTISILNITSPENPSGTLTISLPFSVLVILNWNGTLTEKTLVNMTATCDLPAQYASRDADIESISVGLEGAQKYEPNSSITLFSFTPFDMLTLNRGSSDGNGGVWLNGTSGEISDIVTFGSQGEYSPTMIISHYSTANYTIQGYPDYKVFVNSADVVQQQKDEQIVIQNEAINTNLTYIVIILAIMEGLYLLYDHFPRKEEKEVEVAVNGSSKNITVDMTKRSETQKTKTASKGTETDPKKPSWYRFRRPKNIILDNQTDTQETSKTHNQKE